MLSDLSISVIQQCNTDLGKNQSTLLPRPANYYVKQADKSSFSPKHSQTYQVPILNQNRSHDPHIDTSEDTSWSNERQTRLGSLSNNDPFAMVQQPSQENSGRGYSEGQPHISEVYRRSDESSSSGNRTGRTSNELSHQTNGVYNMHSYEPRKVQANALHGDEHLESSGWIHRDKLAMIESQEMAEAGLIVPPQRCVEDSSNGTTQFSKEVLRDGQDPRINGSSFQPSHSYQPSHNDLTDEEQPMDQDFRTPDEIAMDPYNQSLHPAYRQIGLRASSSRIPLSTSSPVPIPQEHLERSTPLPRKRAASNTRYSGDEDNLLYSKTRPRSRSAGSQNLLSDGEITNGPLPSTAYPYNRDTSPGSPNAQTTKTNSVNHQRKISASTRYTSGPKPRVISTNGRGSPNNQRQASRSGADGRPATAVNRPEGDAPWLATMYKPDPMLPPDQQLLPTHVKRLQQKQEEQQAREGKLGTRFVHNSTPSTPSAIRSHERLKPPSPNLKRLNSKDESQTEEKSTWPLDTSIPDPPKSPAATSDHGGYSTIPRMQGPPSIGPVSSPRLPQPMQVQSPLKQPDKKSRGCHCCIVM